MGRITSAFIHCCCALAFGILFHALGSKATSHVPCTPPDYTELLDKYGKISYNRSVITTSPEAQQLFSLGMILAADYNQLEARRAFRAALKYDITCAMCWWGLAYARGPFQNKPALALPANLTEDSFPHFTMGELEAAKKAIINAAALVGLVSRNSAQAEMESAAAALYDAGDGRTDRKPSTGAGPRPKRLMEKLTRCRTPSTSGSNSSTSTAGGPGPTGGTAGRRRVLSEGAGEGDAATLPPSDLPPDPPLPPSTLLSDDPPPPPPAPPAPAPPAPPPPPPLEGLALERHYIAAMFDRLSITEVYGTKWEQAERRYVRDMQLIARCAPTDADAPALAAEALANCTPWNFTGEPNEQNGLKEPAPYNSTLRVLKLIDQALLRNPNQLLALHLKIHVTETFPAGKGNGSVAGLGESAADTLSRIAPDLDHLQHMPSHNYVRVGRWRDAAEVNVRALQSSVRASNHCLSSLYPDHNAAMVVFAASMGGNLRAADTYARVTRELKSFVRGSPASLGYQWPAPLMVWVRFALWRLIQESPPPPVAVNSTLANITTQVWGNTALHARGPVEIGPAGQKIELAPVNSSLVANLYLDDVLKSKPGPYRGPLKPYEFSKDGDAYAVAAWAFARVMAIAAEYEAGQGDPRGPSSGASETAGPSSAHPTGGAGHRRHLAERVLVDTTATFAGSGNPGQATPSPGVAPASSKDAAPSATDKEADAARESAEREAGGDEAEAGGDGSSGGSEGWAEARAKKLRVLEDKLRQATRALRNATELLPKDVPIPPGQGLGVVIPGYHILSKILLLMADARIEQVLHSNLTAAETFLRDAVEVEGRGGYMEPPRLGPQPARQCLGALQLKMGKVPEAIQTYLDDLRHYPENPWSLRGLMAALADPRVSAANAAPQLKELAAKAEAVKNAAGADNQNTVMHFLFDTSCPAFFPPHLL